MRSIFGGEFDPFAQQPEVKAKRTVHILRLVTIGRVLLVLELYLLIASRLALASNALIAPPVLVFLALDQWLPLSLVVALVCAAEFLWRRTLLAAFCSSCCDHCGWRRRIVAVSRRAA